MSKGRNGAPADLILTNGHVALMDDRFSFASAVAIRDGRIISVGSDRDALGYKREKTVVVDVRGRTVVPGLNDSHLHIIREGLNYNLELSWGGVPSLVEALKRLKEQAERTPPPQWVRVVGGWSEYQFEERRMPTLEEINQATQNTPAFILHLYHCAMLNRAALRACGYDGKTPNPAGGEIQHDGQGNPTGLLMAKPAATILYATHAKGPKLSYADQLNSTVHFLRELNRFGVTSAVDAGGGFQNYPDDYAVVGDLARQKQLTVRIAYNLFTQRPKQELQDFTNWVKMTKPGDGDAFYHVNGAGEMLVYSAADYENFPEPRPDLPPEMEGELKSVVSLLARNHWPFRLHATYGESIERFLNVFEEVNDEEPIHDLRWFFDHAETISDRDIKRVRELGGSIAVQDRMAYQGEYFIERYDEDEAEHTPPIRKMIEAGVHVGVGTDATRVAGYNPWISLYWLVAGKTLGGRKLYSEKNRLDRNEALKLYTLGSAWFSREEKVKGSVEVGKFADLTVLSADYFSIPEDQIKEIESVLTIVDGKPVYGTGEFQRLAPPASPISPPWSPVAYYGGYASHGC